MKNLLCLCLFVLFHGLLLAQSPVILKGKIGKYSIEMELQGGKKAGKLTGKYRYAGKSVYLDLEGTLFPGGVLHLEESWKGDVSGQFYVENMRENAWEGTWVGKKAGHRVSLSVESGDFFDLAMPDLGTYRAKASASISGSYATEAYFINDLFYSEERLEMEIGFNGGMVSVAERGQDSVFVWFDLICGPTYHFASFSGVAVHTGPGEYTFNESMYDGADDACHLIFRFRDKSLEIEQVSSGMDCGFGARAFAGGKYDKVSDVVGEQEETGLGDILGR